MPVPVLSLGSSDPLHPATYSSMPGSPFYLFAAVGASADGVNGYDNLNFMGGPNISQVIGYPNAGGTTYINEHIGAGMVWNGSNTYGPGTGTLNITVGGAGSWQNGATALDNGSIMIKSAMIGTGKLDMQFASSAEFVAPVAAGQTVILEAGSVATIDHTSTFHGLVDMVGGAGEYLHINNLGAPADHWTYAGGVLKLFDGLKSDGQIHLNAAAGFSVAGLGDSVEISSPSPGSVPGATWGTVTH